MKTSELINTILQNQNKFVEARLLLKGGYSTHFFYYNGVKLFDEGLDGEVVKSSLQKFGDFYENCFWKVDLIV
jgi:hypothetical protein